MDLTLFILFIGLIISIYYFIGVLNDLKLEIKNLNVCSKQTNNSVNIPENKEYPIIQSIKNGLELLKNFI